MHLIQALHFGFIFLITLVPFVSPFYGFVGSMSIYVLFHLKTTRFGQQIVKLLSEMICGLFGMATGLLAFG
jgi:hypothetical protein